MTLAFTLAAAPAQGAIRFGADPAYYPANDDPSAIVTGDWNGDGVGDVATANTTAGTVSVLVGRKPFLSTPSSYVVGGQPSDIAAGDFNADGKQDLAVTGTNGAAVQILLGAGDGTFTMGQSVAGAGPADQVAIADLNHDSAPDMVTAGSAPSGGTVHVFLGGPGGFAAPKDYAVGAQPHDVAIGDVDGDGQLDILAPDFASRTTSMLPGVGDGSFGAERQVPGGPPHPRRIVAADFNRDGHADIAVAGDGEIGVIFMLGGGLGGNSYNFTPAASAAGFLTADLDGDGAPDLAVGAGKLWTLHGLGNGGFEAPVSQTRKDMLDIVAFDATADGLPDIASAATGTRYVTLAGNGSLASGALPPSLPPPALGSTANATPASGSVLVKAPGTNRFVRLGGAQQIPIGSQLDTTKGSVDLTTAANATGATQSGTFSGGIFTLAQRSGPHPFTDLVLGGPKLRCRAGNGQVRLVRHSPTARQLFANVHGRYRSRGRNSIATVNGTKWLTKDTCAGTLTLVRQGTVVVRDLVKHRTVTLRSGQRYVARRGNR